MKLRLAGVADIMIRYSVTAVCAGLCMVSQKRHTSSAFACSTRQLPAILLTQVNTRLPLSKVCFKMPANTALIRIILAVSGVVYSSKALSKDLVTLRQISKNLQRFLGRLGYLPPGSKFGLKSGLR